MEEDIDCCIKNYKKAWSEVMPKNKKPFSEKWYPGKEYRLK
ncbi:MAG TPA: hypothetical protein VK105_08755 [Virgibacillus sp.]|nr:hypothetical protein [Virgibacillus sp.]HLR67208.1 hypothetical protein [Virgibacillus sp.]